jgi:leucyl aminopeptidase
MSTFQQPSTLVGKGPSTPILLVRRGTLKAVKSKLGKAALQWLEAHDYRGGEGQSATLPSKDGAVACVLWGIGDATSPWAWAGLPGALPKARYHVEETLTVDEADAAALGWALASHRFTRYLTVNPPKRGAAPELVWPAAARRERVKVAYEAITFGRDLITTPAEDMGPEELAAAASALAHHHGADVHVTVGDDLLRDGYPMVHTVGRASERAPRLVDLRWGAKDAPKLTLVGKGVCFDTGGLDLKSAAGMKMMKKDMGGAATVLALAHAIMSLGLRVRLRVLVPAVENAVSGRAIRPMDVIKTRKGLTVEIGNTDAEGRLILCDAIAEACSEKPDVLIDVATLTGAARIALGTELPALFCNDEALAGELIRHGEQTDDPLWRLPLYKPYRKLLESKHADLNNISSAAEGGAITAALFLERFVDDGITWAHVDTNAWNTNGKPGRPHGGEVMGLRALLSAFEVRFGVGGKPKAEPKPKSKPKAKAKAKG